MLLHAVAESHGKALKILEPSIERLMAGSSATLELSYTRRIMGTRGAHDGLLTTVSLIGNDLFAGGDFALEALRLPEDSDVMLCSRERTIHPNELIPEDGDSKLVIDSSLMKLVGVIFGVLRHGGVCGFVDQTMHPIHSDDEVWVVIVIDRWVSRIPALGPNDLRDSIKHTDVSTISSKHRSHKDGSQRTYLLSLEGLDLTSVIPSPLSCRLLAEFKDACLFIFSWVAL